VDAGVTAAARALDAGDVIRALGFVAARSDAAALSLRGIAMARLGELDAARAHLRRAEKLFGEDEGSWARCRVARAEVELAMRRLEKEPELDRAIRVLERLGDTRNAAWAELVAARRAIVLGRADDAERYLAKLDGQALPPIVLAVRALAELEIAVQRLDGRAARAAVARATELARVSKITALAAEIAKAANMLDRVVALVRSRGVVREARLDDVSELVVSGALVVDACRRRVFHGAESRDLSARPVPFAILRALAEAYPDDVGRDELAAIAFGARHPNESHRVRLRVEIGRARGLIRGLGDAVATSRGYRLASDAEVMVMSLVDETGGADVLSLVESGGAWTASSLAAALGCGVRRVQRGLAELAREDRVRSIGMGRAKRWVAAPRIASHLLLPGLLVAR
jgi:tetratricopeptide (TPR) repeat protein